MPSLWKKSASTTTSKGYRISRLVADLQSPPKRGGSLVVETGFPTSLVDLFVKNRDRLRKPSSKKKRASNTSPLELPPAPPPPALSPCHLQPLPTHPPFPPQPVPDDSADSEVPRCSISQKVEGIPLQDTDVPCPLTKIEEIKGVPHSNNVVLWVFKVAVVVILALCTKKLVLGMTMAAFFLLLVEYMGDRLLAFLKPCRNSVVRLISLCFRWVDFGRDGKLGSKESGILLDHEVEGGEGCRVGFDSSRFMQEAKVGNEDSYDHIDEIEVMEPDFHGDACGIHEITRTSSLPVDIEEMAWKEMVVEECGIGREIWKNGMGKKGKFWKKFVPHKLRKKKDEKGRQSDEDASVIRGIEHEADNDEKKEPDVMYNDCWLSSPLEEETEQGLPKETKQSHIGEKGDEKETKQAHDGEKGDEKLSGRLNRNDGILKYMFMVMIVLAGLLIGRIVALVVTLICALVFKMARKSPDDRRVTRVYQPNVQVRGLGCSS
ncbi:hypothetical protein Dimus_031590 [Dionaea muscipula]